MISAIRFGSSFSSFVAFQWINFQSAITYEWVRWLEHTKHTIEPPTTFFLSSMRAQHHSNATSSRQVMVVLSQLAACPFTSHLIFRGSQAYIICRVSYDRFHGSDFKPSILTISTVVAWCCRRHALLIVLFWKKRTDTGTTDQLPMTKFRERPSSWLLLKVNVLQAGVLKSLCSSNHSWLRLGRSICDVPLPNSLLSCSDVPLPEM